MTQKDNLTAIADAIRAKKGSTDKIKASDFANEITNLPSGGGGDDPFYEFWNENLPGYYQEEAKWIDEAKVQWQESGIKPTDTNYYAIHSKYSNDLASIRYLPKINCTSSTYLSSFYNLLSLPYLKYSGYTFNFTYNKKMRYIGDLDLNLSSLQFSDLFYGLSDLRRIKSITVSSAPITYMPNMFRGCYSLTSIPSLDTSSVTSMYNTFYECKSLATIPQLNTSKVTNMGYMFYDCKSLTSIPLLDTSSVTDMGSMFYNCSSLATIPQLNTSKVTKVSTMFENCSSLTTVPLLDTSSVTNIANMFASCSSLTTVPLLDTSKVTNISMMFHLCEKLLEINLTDTSKCRDFSFFCSNNHNLKSIRTLDLSSLTSNNYFFTNSSSYQPQKLETIEFVPNTINVPLCFNYCKNLTDESLDSIIKGLKQGVSYKTITFSTVHRPESTNEFKLTQDQVLEAQQKGWTVAFL